jgi:hypothetical protein
VNLLELAVALEAAPEKVMAEAEKVVKRGCLNIKRDARKGARGIAHAPRYPQSITYDTWRFADEVIGEAGPEDGTGGGAHQGFLGRILEYGGTHSGPHPHVSTAFLAEEPRFLAAVGDLAGDVLL